MSKQKSRLNLPIVWNFTNQGDFIDGREMEAKPNINGNWLCKCYPRDIYEEEITSLNPWAKNPNIEKMKEAKTVIIEDGCRQIFPRGSLSPYRDIIIYLTPDMKGLEIIERNVKAFRLIGHFKLESLQYKVFYEKTLRAIQSLKELGKPLEQLNAHIADDFYRIIDLLERYKINAEEKSIQSAKL